MGSRKRTVELIFDLQWRNKPDNGGDKSNIIGMYDTPTTTSNFEMFKSYLLKNSGVAGDDVKVTYLTDDGQEWVIDCQEWFEIALSAFRLKARLGEIICLKLDKISSGRRKMSRKHSNDVETQSDVDSMGNNNAAAPPEWFLAYMKQFKRDVVDEVTLAVAANMTPNFKEKDSVFQVAANTRKCKPEPRRCRKYMVLGENQLEKEVLKTIKSERRLENKLDKLDAKTKKIIDKKQALIRGFENELRNIRRSRRDEARAEDRCFTESSPLLLPQQESDADIKTKDAEVLVYSEDGAAAMNATLVNSSSSDTYEHLMGGEIYLHTWTVMNNGKLPWTSNTELRLTWGSTNLTASVKCIKCPPLKPWEKGFISVRFEVPKKPGTYESYWNFYDKNVRFGSSLSCCIVVVEPLASIFSEKAKQADDSRALSKLMSSPKETDSSDAKFETKKDDKENKKLIIFPGGVEAQAPITMPVPEEAAKILYVPNERDKMPLYKKSEIAEKYDEAEFKRDKSDLLNKLKEPLSHTSSHITELREGIENMHIAVSPPRLDVDSDSDWESVNELRVSSNKYGINEKDLLVDLGESSVDNKNPKNINKEEVNTNQDNNNNADEKAENNNSLRGSISEISDGSSDVSSGYDVLNIAACEEREDESTGYVYITIDGNKLSVPKHILRSDFLANAETAPAPSIIQEEEEKMAEQKKDVVPPENYIPTRESSDPKADDGVPLLPTTSIPDVPQSSVTGGPFSDAASSRLFIFPQNHPGYEVVTSALNETEQNKTTPPNGSNDSNTGNTWRLSPTSYTLTDLQNAFTINMSNLKTDPYEPLNQPPPANQEGRDPVEQQSESCAFSQACGSCVHNPPVTQQYQHVPNFQQTFPKERLFKKETPTAPPPPPPPPPPGEQPRTSEQSSGGSVPTMPPPPGIMTSPGGGAPVHILPENLVNGAVNVARSVINMIAPQKQQPGRWVNGHWVTERAESLRAKNLVILAEMGFLDADLNATLLARYNDNVARVLNELLE